MNIRLQSSFHVELMIEDLFLFIFIYLFIYFFAINNVAYFSLRNFNIMHIITLLDHGIRAFFLEKKKKHTFQSTAGLLATF